MGLKIIVFGTRPEFLKLVPVIEESRKRKLEDEFKLIYTRQHRELVEDLFPIFGIQPEIILPVNNFHSSISETLSQIISELQKYILNERETIDYVIGQGDTSSCMGAAIVARLNKIPFAHIEAGLRTFDFDNPFPEEYFRQLISISSTIHFTPTLNATKNLIDQGVPSEQIIQTGNTIIDLINVLNKNPQQTNNKEVKKFIDSDIVLITCHRRENQNHGFHCLISSIKKLSSMFPALHFVWISHKNPFITTNLSPSIFSDCINLSVIDPVNIVDMIWLYQASKVIITDSGGIQEEALTLDIPTIVIRQKTERTEAIDSGNSILVGNSKAKIIEAFNFFMTNSRKTEQNPFGDGLAANRIISFFKGSTIPAINISTFSAINPIKSN
jgi:UDP-N-acetylglucosamine 2-epimerase (non-hydrolysing)